jgi:hypothetical protein
MIGIVRTEDHTMARKADIITSDHGSIWSFAGCTKRGKAWLARNLADHAGEHHTAYAEARYAVDIAFGALHDGLRLQDAATGRFASLPAEG